jgi:RNA polymerase sigma-70 factor (ECF subfamily)
VSPLLFKRLSDESLGSRHASGEAAAFDELYRRYVNRLAAYGSHLLGDAASGDDVAQATMLKAYAALRSGRLPEKMKPWLFRIAHNAAIDLVARRREFATEHLPEQPSADREPFAGALVEALATLPDRQRRVYLLREVHGLRIDETCAELGLTAAQVEQSLFAARNRLAEQLVFGDRLNCVTVQRLAAGPLDASERRALKTHLRSCHECRGSLGLRGRALTLVPSATGLEWLRGLGAGLIGGGAPAAAKVGAVFATATIVGGGTVAVEKGQHQHARRTVLKVVPVAPVAQTTRRAPLVAATAPVHRVVAEHRETSSDDSSSDSTTKEHETQHAVEHDGASSEDSTVHADGERAATTEREGPSQRERTRSHEHSGASVETEPPETQPAEHQDPPENTIATGTAEVTTPALPVISPETDGGD